MNYTGQLSFDFVDSNGKLYLIECNPRTTDGALLMTAEHLAGGITEPDHELTMVPEGTEVHELPGGQLLVRPAYLTHRTFASGTPKLDARCRRTP